MAAGDLTTLENVKQWLNIQTTNDDALLTRLVTAASALVQRYIQRNITAAEYTETYECGGRLLVLRNAPIISVISVTLDGGVAVPAQPGAGQPGYSFDDYALRMEGYGFLFGRQSISITYQAGYASTPFDIEQAVIELISLRYRERDRIGLVSKGLAGETTSYSQSDMTASIKTALKPYRRMFAL